MLKRIGSGLLLGGGIIFCIAFGSFLYASLVFVIFVAAVYECSTIITKSASFKAACFKGHAESKGVEEAIIKQIVLSICAVMAPVIALLYLRFWDGAKGFYLTIWLFVCIWSFDTIAFFAGRAIGGPKLAPSISPKKTWSGFIFGIFGAVISCLLVHYVLNFNTNAIVFVLITILLAVLSQMGDLAESKFKRHHKVKDSGSIIPGHGGVLDRMDGFFLAAPALMILYILWSSLAFVFGFSTFI